MRRYRYVLLDVFTHNPMEGNPLAVFTDAHGLSFDEMQRIANEMNLSETTFVLPRAADMEEREGVRVRIFTTQEEMPFAGHPTLGTAWLLQREHGGEQIELALNIGKIPIRFATNEAGRLAGEMRQRDPEFGEVFAAEEVARAAAIPLDWIDTSLPIQTVSTGTPFTIVPLRTLDAMHQLQVNVQTSAAFLRPRHSHFFFFVSREVETAGATLHARMQFYNGEDPATGSASGCATAWALRHGVLASEQSAIIEQGLEIKRPSFIHIRGRRTAEGATDIRVGGEVVVVAEGKFFLA